MNYKNLTGNAIKCKKYELTLAQIRNLLHCATGDVKDFVMDESGFVKE